MKGNPAVPRSPLTSKPTWSNTCGCSATSVFLFRRRTAAATIREHPDGHAQLKHGPANRPGGQRLPGTANGARVPMVAVVLSDDTLVITLHGALSPAEKVLAGSPAGAAQVQEFHRQLFANDSDALRQEIKRITGVEV